MCIPKRQTFCTICFKHREIKMDTKNNGKNKTALAVIIGAIIIVIAIVGIFIVKNNTEKAIKSGLDELVNERINDLLIDANNPESGSPIWTQGLTGVDYEITNIEKKDGIYILTLEINCVYDDVNASETTQSLLANEVERCFRIHDEFSVGKYQCRYYYGLGNDYAYDPMVYTYVNGALIHEPEKLDTASNKDTVKCESCGNRYKKGSDNANSIALSSMCEKCYENFLWTQDAKDAIDNLPVD